METQTSDFTAENVWMLLSGIPFSWVNRLKNVSIFYQPIHVIWCSNNNNNS